MSQKESSKSIVMVITIILITIFTSGSSVNAKQGDEFGLIFQQDPQAIISDTPPGGPGFVSIPAAAFRPKYTYTDWHYWGSYLYNDSTGGQNGNYIAAVNLPDGAIVNKFIVSYLDEATQNLTAKLLKINMYTAGNNEYEMANTQTSLNLGFGHSTDSTIDYPEINNQESAYYVEVLIPAGANTELCLKSVRIDYQFSTYLGLINK